MYKDLGVSYSYDIGLDNRLPALIPTHNAKNLLLHSFNIMKNAGCDQIIYPIVIDDRSNEDIKKLCDKYGFGYIRIDHDLKFNYSINMNIGSKIIYSLGVETVLFLNNDCYLYDKKKLETFIERHFNNNSDLSCPKLVYPPVRYSFKKDVSKQNTVQFGGGYFVQNNLMFPDHFGRGFSPNNPLVNIDKKNTYWLTGAMNLINLDKFISIGCYDIELDGAFQDVFLSLMFKQQQLNTWYFGQDIDFYHDETTTRMNEWLNNGQNSVIKYRQKISNINSKKYKIENE